MKKGDQIKNYCRRCDHETNHTVVSIESERSKDSDYDYQTDYMVVRCLGCETYSFREDMHDYEMIVYDDENITTTRIYPQTLRGHKVLDSIWNFPFAVHQMYQESFNALSIGCKLLAGVGFRGVIEAVCVDQNIKGRNLEQQINALMRTGLITKKECDRLHSVRFLGNDSIHEMKEPTQVQLLVVLEIIEHLLANLYLIDDQVARSLERPVSEYSDFLRILERNLAAHVGEELPLIKIFGRDVRLVKEHLDEFEQQLLDAIQKGTYQKVQIGKIEPTTGKPAGLQYYEVV